MEKIDYIFKPNSPCPSDVLNQIVNAVNANSEWIDEFTAGHPIMTDISEADVIGLDEKYIYDGESVKPNVTLYLGGKLLEYGIGFTASYKNNNKIGTAKVTYLGLFPYSGKLEKTFDIEGKPYTLTYDTSEYEGVEAPSPKSISVIGQNDLPTLTLPYNSFQGWFTSKQGGTKVAVGTILNDNTTIYAKFKQNQFTLTFVTDHGTEPSSITTGVIPDLTKAPYKLTEKNYAFGGWYLDEELETKAESGMPIEADTTLYAKWVSLMNTFEIVGDTITASAEEGAEIELYKDGEKMDSLTDTLNATATYSTVVNAEGQTQTCVITCTYNKDNEELSFTSTAGNVLVTKGASVVDGAYKLYNEDVLQTGILTIIDDASNTASVEIKNV